MTEEQLQKEQEELFDVHFAELVKEFGEKRANLCNLGSASGEDWITSKMYPMNKSQKLQWLTTRICADGYKHTIE